MREWFVNDEFEGVWKKVSKSSGIILVTLI
jgi:hypothetical protein